MRFCLSSCIFLAAFVFNTPSYSQNGHEPINSSKVIEEGADLYTKGKYKEAIAVFNKVPLGDTNYVDILYNKSLALYQDSNFIETKRNIELGIKLFPEKNNDWYNLLANTLDKMGKPDEAIAYYDKIIQTFNHAYLAWYNKGISYYNQNKFAEATKALQQSVLVNPYYPAAHYYLGMIAYKEGNLVPAVLSFVTCLAVNPESQYGGYAINSLSSIAKVTDDVAKYAAAKKTSPTDEYEMIQEILLSKVALDKQYKIKNDLEDPIVRQMQVVMEKLHYDKSDKGFCMQYYVPFYEEQFKAGKFDDLIYEALSGLDGKEVQAAVKKNKKKVDGFIENIVAYFNDIRETQVLSFEERKSIETRVFYSDNKPFGKGKTLGQGKNALFVGPWEFYHPNGQLKSKGLFSDKQEKNGEWTFYHLNGKMKEKTIFKDNKAEGKSTSWYTNGQVFTEDNYKNGELDGLYIERYYNGMLRKTEHYVAGKKQGEARGYESSGKLDYVATYADDEENGLVTYYHPNGKPSSVGNYVKGEAVGSLKTYYLDGTPKLEGSFTNGKRAGVWKDYHNNNTIKSIANYTNGEMDGEYKEFYDNGKPLLATMYAKDKVEGKYENFDSDGKLFSESTYEKGRLREIKFFDKTGKVISNTTTRTGAGNLVFFDAQGNKTSEGYFTKEGLRNGKTTYYYRNGKVSSVANFKDGLLNGENISYYRDGSISSKVSYKDDEENGYKLTYFANGKIKSEGYVGNGVNEGVHISYNQLGGIYARSFSAINDLQGNYEYFYPNGKRQMDLGYRSGWLNSIKTYDTTGNTLEDLDFENGDISYSLNSLSGKLLSRGAYKNHYLNGERKFFFPDGSLRELQYFKYNVQDSIAKEFFYGGKTNFEGQYKMGEKDGKWNYYYDNGQLYYSETYNNGRQNGITKTYNENGTLDKEITYKENNLDGEYKVYGDNGQLAVVLTFDEASLVSYTYEGKDGKLVPAIPVKNGTALVTGFYKNGTKSTELNYEDDEINGVRKIYFSNGKNYVDGSRLLGYDHGVKKIYYTNGQLEKEENYYYGQLHGTVKKYYENGKLKAEENWYNGDQHDASKYYDNTGKLVQTKVYYYGELETVK